MKPNLEDIQAQYSPAFMNELDELKKMVKELIEQIVQVVPPPPLLIRSLKVFVVNVDSLVLYIYAQASNGDREDIKVN